MDIKDCHVEERLCLGSDMYSYTFFKFIKADNPILLGGLMMKSYFTVVIQIFLTTLKWNEKLGKPIFLGDAKLNVARVICSYIMHM